MLWSSAGVRDLTGIASDTARPGVGIGKLITAGCLARVVIAPLIGTNPETQRFMLQGSVRSICSRRAHLRSVFVPVLAAC